MPTDELKDIIRDILDSAGFDDVSVIAGPTAQVKVPAVVLRADNPWIVPSRFCVDEQRYAAVIVTSASTPHDAETRMYRIAHYIMQGIGSNESEPWSWVEMTSPVVDETTGSAYLAATLRLRYLNSEVLEGQGS